MQLNQVTMKYFRSLYDVRLPLKPLTILIGSNATGKSNLFKALQFLYDGVAGDRLNWQGYDNQMEDLVWYGLNEFGFRPSGLNFSLVFDGLGDVNNQARYLAEFKCKDYIEVAHEALDVLLAPNDENFMSLYERRDSSITRRIGTRGRPIQSRMERARSARSLTLRDEGPNFSLNLAKDVYEHIHGWRFFDINLRTARQPAFIPQYPEEVPPLANDGSNLSAFLWAVAQIQPDDLETIVDELRNSVEVVENVQVEHDAERGGRLARYGFIEKSFGEFRPPIGETIPSSFLPEKIIPEESIQLVPPESMSDGTIRLFALMGLLFADRSVSLACLEEPDRGLHPRLMLYLADILRQAVTGAELDKGEIEKPPQIIVTTHSPEFMDCFDLDAEEDYLQVYIVNRDESGKTFFVSPSAKQFAPWLEQFRLGEAVRRRFI